MQGVASVQAPHYHTHICLARREGGGEGEREVGREGKRDRVSEVGRGREYERMRE